MIFPRPQRRLRFGGSVGGVAEALRKASGGRTSTPGSGTSNPNSPLLAPFADTRVVGMAATLAGLIRGRDVVEDAQALKAVAAAQFS